MLEASVEEAKCKTDANECESYFLTTKLETFTLWCAARLVGKEHMVRTQKHVVYSSDSELGARANNCLTRSSKCLACWFEFELGSRALRHVAHLSNVGFKERVHYEWRPRVTPAQVLSVSSAQTQNVEVPCLIQHKLRLDGKPKLIPRFFKKISTTNSHLSRSYALEHSIPGVKTFELRASSSEAISISSSEDLREHFKKILHKGWSPTLIEVNMGVN